MEINRKEGKGNDSKFPSLSRSLLPPVQRGVALLVSARNRRRLVVADTGTFEWNFGRQFPTFHHRLMLMRRPAAEPTFTGAEMCPPGRGCGRRFPLIGSFLTRLWLVFDSFLTRFRIIFLDYFRVGSIWTASCRPDVEARGNCADFANYKHRTWRVNVIDWLRFCLRPGGGARFVFWWLSRAGREKKWIAPSQKKNNAVAVADADDDATTLLIELDREITFWPVLALWHDQLTTLFNCFNNSNWCRWTRHSFVGVCWFLAAKRGWHGDADATKKKRRNKKKKPLISSGIDCIDYRIAMEGIGLWRHRQVKVKGNVRLPLSPSLRAFADSIFPSRMFDYYLIIIIIVIYYFLI